MTVTNDSFKSKTKHFQNCLGVFQGGGVKAIAYAGAFEEAISRGVFFSELIGASAGSIIAVLIAAGAKPREMNEILAQLKFHDFLRPPVEIENFQFTGWAKMWTRKKWETLNNIKSFVRFLGIHDGSRIEEWINEELKRLLGLNSSPTFRDLYVPTSVVATDIRERKAKVWNYHETPNYEVARAVRASCSMPGFFQPQEKRYVDGGMLSNLPSFLLKPTTIFDKILAFGFQNDEASDEIQSCTEYLFGLANTVVDGAVDIQLQLQENIHSIRIDTLGVKSTDFKKLNRELVTQLVIQGRNAAAEFFDKEDHLPISNKKRDDVAFDLFESFNLLLKSMYSNPKEILLSDDDPAWLYSLFPLLIKWKQDHVEVNVLLKQNGESQTHREYKIRLLKALGFAVEERSDIPFRGFIIDGYLSSGNSYYLIRSESPRSSLNLSRRKIPSRGYQTTS